MNLIIKNQNKMHNVSVRSIFFVVFNYSSKLLIKLQIILELKFKL